MSSLVLRPTRTALGYIFYDPYVQMLPSVKNAARGKASTEADLHRRQEEVHLFIKDGPRNTVLTLSGQVGMVQLDHLSRLVREQFYENRFYHAILVSNDYSSAASIPLV